MKIHITVVLDKDGLLIIGKRGDQEELIHESSIHEIETKKYTNRTVAQKTKQMVLDLMEEHRQTLQEE